MLKIALAVVALLCLLLPQWWIKRVLKKHNHNNESVRGTGGELAAHLCQRFDLQVELIKGENDLNYYDSEKRQVVIQSDYFDNKSLTAVAVVAHEIAHAIQDKLQSKLLKLRLASVKATSWIRNLGKISMLVSLPMILFQPRLALLVLAFGVASHALHLLVCLITVPVELDASFNIALPLLISGNYIKKNEIGAVRQVLRACAWTYVANSMVQIIYFWYRMRWGLRR